jgi:hypothetical protein
MGRDRRGEWGVKGEGKCGTISGRGGVVEAVGGKNGDLSEFWSTRILRKEFLGSEDLDMDINNQDFKWETFKLIKKKISKQKVNLFNN